MNETLIESNPGHAPVQETRPRYKSLLYMCEYPPSTQAGAPVIAKQLLRGYDLSHLHILCCEKEYAQRTDLVKASYLACDHTRIPTYQRFDLRPRRFFVPMAYTVNCLRIPRILREARRIVREKRVEAVFTIPWRCEFALAAYLLHVETGLPLYVFETDDWVAMNPDLVQGYLTRKFHTRLLREAEHLWVTSPNMQATFRDRFEVESEFLFHFVDLEAYQEAAVRYAVDDETGPVRMVYTGSINAMFYDTMKYLCDRLNRGLFIGGRPVELAIYGGHCPPELLGDRVSYEGLVDIDDIPRILAESDLAVVCVSFSQEPDILELVKTSLYTKTIDYLASGKPVLVISPPYTGEVDYFGGVTTVVTELKDETIEAALYRIMEDHATTRQLSRKGLDLVAKRHSLASLQSIFLHHFQKDDAFPVGTGQPFITEADS